MSVDCIKGVEVVPDTSVVNLQKRNYKHSKRC